MSNEERCDPKASLTASQGGAPSTAYDTTPGESTLALLRDLAARRTIDGQPAWVVGAMIRRTRDVWGRPKGADAPYSLRTLQLAIAEGLVEVREPRGDLYRISAAGMAALEGAS